MENVNLVSRQSAIASGAVRYFTGRPCKQGHVDARTVRNSSCTACTRQGVNAWQKRNAQKTKQWMDEARARYEQRNPTKVLRAKRAYKERHPEKIHAANVDYYAENKGRICAAKKSWLTANPAARAEWERTRQARKLKAMPAWANREAIKEVYREAARRTAETGIKHSVDHFYPLQGKTVCGLHVETNLQVITLVENLKKNRRMPSLELVMK